MDADRIAFLFGSLPGGADPDDEETRHRLVAERWSDDPGGRSLADFARQRIADQIALDDPPEVWQTVQRLRAGGGNDKWVMTNLGLAEIMMIRQLLGPEGTYDAEVQRDLLASLPLPGPGEVFDLVVATAARRRAVGKQLLIEEIGRRYGVSAGPDGSGPVGAPARLVAEFVEQTVTTLLERDETPLLELNGDLVVHLASVAEGASFAHLLDPDELVSGAVAVEPDLVALYRLSVPTRVHLVARGGAAVEVGELDYDEDPEVGDVVVLPAPVLGELASAEPLGEPALLAVRVVPLPAGAGEATGGSEGEPAVEGPSTTRGSLVEARRLEQAPALPAGLVEHVRAAYEAEADGLPVRVERVLARLLLEHPGVLDQVVPPLRELLAMAGLIVRGGSCADDEELWRRGRLVLRLAHLADLLGVEDDFDRAADVIQLFEPAGGQEPGGEAWHGALLHLGAVEVLMAVTTMLLDEAGGGGRRSSSAGLGEGGIEAVAEFAGALIGAARQPREAAPARFVMALAEELLGDALAAEAELELAHRARPDLEPVTERLAWYASDRGDAKRAVALYDQLDTDAHSVQVRGLRRYSEARPRSGAGVGALGRNDPCWCRSGRKFKHCHLGAPPSFSLPERVDWVLYKAADFFRHQGPGAIAGLEALAACRVGGASDREALLGALDDTFVLDVAMHEGGWFGRFLAARGALLPDDEELLAEAWTFVDRSLHEVVEVRPGRSLTVRDLRSAELIEVSEGTMSRTARVGEVYCARVLPDGEGHRFGGAMVKVRAGDEAALFEVLDRHDAPELLAFVGARERPPRLTTREGEPWRSCRAVVSVAGADGGTGDSGTGDSGTGDSSTEDASSAGVPGGVAHNRAVRAVLDRLYGPGEGDVWTEDRELESGETILRATLRLDGDRLVVDTMSEARMDRVLALLGSELPGCEVVEDERHDVDPAALDWGNAPAGFGSLGQPGRSRTGASLSPDDPAARTAMRRFIAEQERVWCDEVVPALGGLTPRQAAADPAGREALERLLGEYGDHVDPSEDPDLVMQHPARLRAMLGL